MRVDLRKHRANCIMTSCVSMRKRTLSTQKVCSRKQRRTVQIAQMMLRKHKPLRASDVDTAEASLFFRTNTVGHVHEVRAIATRHSELACHQMSRIREKPRQNSDVHEPGSSRSCHIS